MKRTQQNEELKSLEKRLKEVQEMLSSNWDIVGNELCAVKIISEERELLSKISDIKKEKSMDTTAKIKKLEKNLEDMRSTHRASWDIYGSELCAGDMIRQEEKLEEEIKKLKEKEETNDIPFYAEDPSQIIDD